MNVSLYEAAAGMNASERWQEAIAQNLANNSIPGARKQEVSFSAVQAGLASATNGTTQANYVMPAATVGTSFQPGIMRPTGLNTDMAIEGTGMFEVLMPNGTHAFTRDGEFHINAQGQLVTKQGYKVLNDGGNAIQLDPTNTSSLNVSASGQISQGADAKGRIRMVDFNQPDLLTSAGGGLYLAGNPKLKSTTSSTSTLHQGCLEAANSTPTLEMSKMINSMRMFEVNQKMMSTQDERMGKVISDLGNPS